MGCKEIASLAPLNVHSAVAALSASLDDVELFVKSLAELQQAASSPRNALVVRACIESGCGLAKVVEHAVASGSAALAAALGLCAKLGCDADGAEACSKAGAHSLAARIVCGELTASETVAEAASDLIDAANGHFQPRASRSNETTMGHLARFDVGKEAVLVRALTARQCEQADVGYVTWPAATVLAKMLIDVPVAVIPRCVELGAGTGLVGLVAATLGIAEEVTITDFRPDVLENLRCAVDLNAEVTKSKVKVELLDFSLPITKQFDLALAADCVCCDEDAANLAVCLAETMRKPDGRALVVLASPKSRYGVDRLEKACLNQGLLLELTTLTPDPDDVPLLASSSGYVRGMEFCLFDITWPSSSSQASSQKKA